MPWKSWFLSTAHAGSPEAARQAEPSGGCVIRGCCGPQSQTGTRRAARQEKKKRECERVGSRQLVGQARGGVSAALGSRRTSERISQRIVAD